MKYSRIQYGDQDCADKQQQRRSLFCLLLVARWQWTSAYARRRHRQHSASSCKLAVPLTRFACRWLCRGCSAPLFYARPAHTHARHGVNLLYSSVQYSTAQAESIPLVTVDCNRSIIIVSSRPWMSSSKHACCFALFLNRAPPIVPLPLPLPLMPMLAVCRSKQDGHGHRVYSFMQGFFEINETTGWRTNKLAERQTPWGSRSCQTAR